MRCETCGQTLEEWESGRCEGCGILFSKILSECWLTVRQNADKIHTHETQFATRTTHHKYKRNAVMSKHVKSFAGDTIHLYSCGTVVVGRLLPADRSAKSAYATTYHRDGSVTFWNVNTQQWQRTSNLSAVPMATLSDSERAKITRHLSR